MKNKLRRLTMRLGLSIDTLGSRIIGITPIDSWMERFGGWVQDLGTLLFALAYHGSDEEYNDAIEWAGDWLAWNEPIRWHYLSERQTQIVIQAFGIGPVVCIRKK